MSEGGADDAQYPQVSQILETDRTDHPPSSSQRSYTAIITARNLADMYAGRVQGEGGGGQIHPDTSRTDLYPPTRNTLVDSRHGAAGLPQLSQVSEAPNLRLSLPAIGTLGGTSSDCATTTTASRMSPSVPLPPGDGAGRTEPPAVTTAPQARLQLPLIGSSNCDGEAGMQSNALPALGAPPDLQLGTRHM